jgi:hypothetical protein
MSAYRVPLQSSGGWQSLGAVARDKESFFVPFSRVEKIIAKPLPRSSRYAHDVVIDGGKVRKRKKGPSKQFREKFGHGRSPSGGETARCRGHCGAHVGSLSAPGGREEGPGVRHPALHVLTRGGF